MRIVVGSDVCGVRGVECGLVSDARKVTELSEVAHSVGVDRAPDAGASRALRVDVPPDRQMGGTRVDEGVVVPGAVVAVHAFVGVAGVRRHW